MKSLILCLFLTVGAQAKDYGYLKAEDQKYFKNESQEGNNQLERIDLNVKEINKIYAVMAELKQEIVLLKAEVELLKKKKRQ